MELTPNTQRAGLPADTRVRRVPGSHLEDLIGTGSAGSRRGRTTGAMSDVQRVRPGVQQLVDSLNTVPVLVLGRSSRVLAANELARALFADFEQMPAHERNYAR
jgi:hypothetical protein